MKRIINFILQHFLVTAVVIVFSVVIFREISAPDFNFMESLRKANLTWDLGLFLIVYGSIHLLPNISMLIIISRISKREITNGVIVEKDYNFGAGKSYAYVRYYVDDCSYIVKSRQMSRGFHKGDKLAVVYNKTEPSEAEVCPLSENYLPLGMVLFGVLCVILDLFVF